jgi:hypothetical protein
MNKYLMIVLFFLNGFCYSQTNNSNDLIIKNEKIIIKCFSKINSNNHWNKSIKIRLVGENIKRIKNISSLKIRVYDNKNNERLFENYGFGERTLDKPKRIRNKCDRDNFKEYQIKINKNSITIIKSISQIFETPFSTLSDGYSLDEGKYYLIVDYNNGELLSKKINFTVDKNYYAP